MHLSAVYLQTIQNKMDKLSNNLANSVTPGFKQQLLSLEESYDAQDRANSVAQYGGLPLTNNPVPQDNLYVGRRLDFSPGTLTDTGNSLDMAIAGEGFFQVRTESGELGYTRAGVFTVDSAGNLVNNLGMLLEPRVIIPKNATNVHVEENGTIRGSLKTSPEDDGIDYADYYYADDEDLADGLVTFGRIALYKFVNPDGLAQAGKNIFLPTEASGQALEGTAGEDGYGLIKGSTLERSNTDLVTTMTSIIQLQRAYQLNLKIIRNQDEMSNLAIGMRG
ncbi:MAG: flagellar hook-basal body complex protein [Peptococcaceae bacterium]|jgi:flagellar basal-body rod protein FlgG|nr:flagellar hook-basal body complex protein [Peptococcaceae bacterium]